MAVASVQDRTAEFKSVLAQAQRRQAQSKVGAQRRSLLTDAQKAEANGDRKPTRSEFARKAAEIGRGISATMGKLEKLAQCRFSFVIVVNFLFFCRVFHVYGWLGQRLADERL